MSELTSAQIAEYLREHPEFLSDYPDLALSLRTPREDGATTQLASYQLDILRDRVRGLENRMRDLIAIAQDNEVLLLRLHLLALRLLRITDLRQGVLAIAAGLKEDFQAEQSRLLLIGSAKIDLRAPWLLQWPAGDSRLAGFDELWQSPALCGRIDRDQLGALFGQAAPGIASAVLVPLLVKTQPVGLLAIGSADEQRFHPGMGTDLLTRMGEMIATAVQQWSGHSADLPA